MACLGLWSGRLNVVVSSNQGTSGSGCDEWGGGRTADLCMWLGMDPWHEGAVVYVSGRKQKRVQRFGEGGERERYFADDDKADLATLIKRQKHGGASVAASRIYPHR